MRRRGGRMKRRRGGRMKRRGARRKRSLATTKKVAITITHLREGRSRHLNAQMKEREIGIAMIAAVLQTRPAKKHTTRTVAIVKTRRGGRQTKVRIRCPNVINLNHNEVRATKKVLQDGKTNTW